jgi:hypothetical protein
VYIQSTYSWVSLAWPDAQAGTNNSAMQPFGNDAAGKLLRARSSSAGSVGGLWGFDAAAL